MNLFEKLFKLSKHKTTIKIEVLAGLTTFLTMAYIVILNPIIISDAMGKEFIGALVTSTALASAFACITMALYANMPFGLAPGMGLNAFFAYSVVLGMGIPWQVALGAIFIEGIIFIILSATNVRTWVMEGIPLNLKYAVTVGIGIFIAFIGLSNTGMVIANPATMVAIGSFKTPPVIITVIGTFVTIAFIAKKVRGGLLWGILVSTAIAWIFAFINPSLAAQYKIFLPKGVFAFASIKPLFLKLDLSYLFDKTKIFDFIVILMTFLFVDFFDTLGTIIGVASKGNMLDEKGNLPNAGKALLVDAVGTTVGSLLGASTITTFVESSAGVAEGGRTGLTALVVGLLFLVSAFFSPIFTSIPSCAVAPALIIVGFMMMEPIVKIDFSNIAVAFPSFVTIISMPLMYSIGDGLMLGILSFVGVGLINNIITKDPSKKQKVSPIMIVLAILFILKLAFG